MSTFKAKVIRSGLEALYHTGAYRALAPFARGLGVIFTLHHVLPGADNDRADRFAPNGILEVSPEFLDAVIERIRARGLDIVSLDEARRRIVSDDPRRFAVFTLDDGYRDNHEHAYPVFKKHACPFTVYVASGLPDRTARLWWIALERVIASVNSLQVEIEGETQTYPCRNVVEKYAAWEAVYWPLRGMEEHSKIALVSALASSHGVDLDALLPEFAMGWDELREMASDPLVTIGAHTESHACLATLTDLEMRREMLVSRRRIGEMLGHMPCHVAYPYGDAASAGLREFEAADELGFLTGVTTRKGVVFPEHVDHLMALPRISLNGDYQALRYVDLFISGAPFALYNGFRKVNAA